MPDKFVYGKQKFNKNKRNELRANVQFLVHYIDYLYDNIPNPSLSKQDAIEKVNRKSVKPL